MGTGMELLIMPKPKGRPKTSDRDDVTVKIDRALVGMAKLIATRQGINSSALFRVMARRNPNDICESRVIILLHYSAPTTPTRGSYHRRWFGRLTQMFRASIKGSGCCSSPL